MKKTKIGNKEYVYDKQPDTCPICHNGIDPKTITSSVINHNTSHDYKIQIVYRCPKEKCQNLFIGTYCYYSEPRYSKSYYKLDKTEPYLYKAIMIPMEVKEMSQNYYEIKNQSYSAEQYGLKQIAGCGYRKALEYLVKDFCISKHPDKPEKIKSLFLKNCIEEFIPDGNIKECALRAAWLGNDETHYTRKWEDKDIGSI